MNGNNTPRASKPITDSQAIRPWMDLQNMTTNARCLERHLASLTSKIREWKSMSDSEMRLRCGELSAQDIRNIKAVLEAILPTQENE